MLIYGVSGIFAHKKTKTQFLQPLIEQVLGGGGLDVPGGCAAFLRQFLRATVFLCRFFVVFFQFTDAFFGSILPISAYFLLYIMCISSKSQTVFWAQNFRDVQLIPNVLRYPACLRYCSIWKALSATNYLLDRFSYSNNILTKFLWGTTTQWSEIKIRFKI